MQKITVSFPDEKIKEIMRIARERGESKSTILRMAMELYLRREKREKGDDLLILQQKKDARNNAHISLDKEIVP